MTNINRHDLDEAIDRVAAKLVAIDNDHGALQAVITRLPDQRSTPWFLRMPAQAMAGAALVLLAFLWARPSAPPAMPVTAAPIESVAPPLVSARAVVLASRRPDIRIPDPGPRVPAVAIDRPDHERSLAPVAAISAIELGEIAAPALELGAPVLLEPLVLSELALDTKGDS